MIKLIKSKFEIGKESKTYLRVNSEHPISIFLGYNNKGHKSMVIAEHGSATRLASTQIIEIDVSNRFDGKLSLEFSLIDDRFTDMFYKFCEDIIASSISVEKEKVISFIIKRWNAWLLMFKNVPNHLLSDIEIQGLLGELLILEEKMQPIYGMDRSISAWDGPLGFPKDFVIDNTWYEVKSTNTRNNQIKIDSLEQLDSNEDGYLCIVRLDKTNQEADQGVNLNIVVERIRSKIDKVETLAGFLKRLNDIGYIFDEYYNTVCFNYHGREEYLVNQEFPALRRKDVALEIKKANYEISISELGEYKC